jgi:hypothetical protein
MDLTVREFIKTFGVGGAALAAGVVRGDEADSVSNGQAGVIGDPRYGTCRYIKDIAPFPVDVPSAKIVGGRIVQPSRDIPLFHETDVVVVGGGPAGVAAALASARTGAKTALVERYGSLGGLFTNGLVLIIIGTAEGERYGTQRFVTRGICEEFMRKAEAMGSHVYMTDRRHGPYQPTIDPEGAKILFDRMVRAEKNLSVFFHTWGADTIMDGSTVRGVVFESKQGRQAILAKRVIDCTGDGDVSFQAGAEFRQITHNLGFVYRLGNVGRATLDQRKAAGTEGFPAVANEPAPGGVFWRNRLGPQGNGLSVKDLTAAEFAHREEGWQLVENMRKTPGFEETYMLNSCSQIGVRASRLIKTDYILSMEESNAHKCFDDAIGMSGDDTFSRGAFQIPYRTLLPTGVENLLVAGRAMGVAPNLIDRVRLIPVCMVTGQAAGAAAALSVEAGVSPRSLDAKKLRSKLVSDGVFIA